MEVANNNYLFIIIGYLNNVLHVKIVPSSELWTYLG